MLIFLLFTLPLLIFTLTCEEFLNSLAEKARNKDFSELSLQEKYFLENSARSASDFGLGDKEACDSEPKMTYLVALRVSYQSLGFKTGIHHGSCLPIECSYLSISPNQELLKKLHEIKQWKVEPNETLELYDPESPIGARTFMFFLTIIIFCLFISLSIFSGVYPYIKKKREEMKLKAPHVILKNIHDGHETHNTPGTQVRHNLHDNHDKKLKESSPIHDHSHIDLHDITQITQVSGAHPNSPNFLLQAFDIKENFKALIRSAKEAHTDEHIEALDFLMVATIFYCVYVNIFGPYSRYILNQQSYTDFFSTVWSKIMVSSEIIPEYFFLMDGFNSAWRFFPQIEKAKFGLKIFLKVVKQKLFVKWPLAMIAFLFYWQLTPHFFSGPLGFIWKWEIDSCNKYWWTKALFIDNLTNYYTIKDAGGYCMPLLWYTVSEAQMFILAVFVFALYAKYRKAGLLLIFFLYIQSFGLAIAAFYKYDLTFQYPTAPTLYEVKFKWLPWKRWSNYFLGALCGILYYEYNNLNRKNMFTIFEKSKLISYLVMIIGALFTAFLIFFLVTKDTVPSVWETDLEHMWHAIRIVLSGLSTMLAFMPMIAHTSFFIKKIFASRTMQILQRLSGFVFYYHQGINIGLMYNRTKDVENFSHTDIVIHSMIVFVLCLGIALLFHLTIDKPWNKIIKKILEEKHTYIPLPIKKPSFNLAPLKIVKDVSSNANITSASSVGSSHKASVNSEIELKKSIGRDK